MSLVLVICRIVQRAALILDTLPALLVIVLMVRSRCHYEQVATITSLIKRVS